MSGLDSATTPKLLKIEENQVYMKLSPFLIILASLSVPPINNFRISTRMEWKISSLPPLPSSYLDTHTISAYCADSLRPDGVLFPDGLFHLLDAVLRNLR